MNDEALNRARRIACDYANRETKFARCTVVSVNKAINREHEYGQCYIVKLAMSHSPEQIESLIADSHPDEIELVRDFVKGDFVLNLTIVGDVVVATEWENLDLC